MNINRCLSLKAIDPGTRYDWKVKDTSIRSTREGDGGGLSGKCRGEPSSA